MTIKSLFDYASVLQDNHYTKGEFLSHFEILDQAAVKLVEGYSSLNEAESEDLTRYCPYGFEIAPDAIYDAVNYLRETPERKDLPYRNTLKIG